MPRTVKPPTPGPRSGSSGRGGGSATQVAEEYAAALARGREVNSLKGLDAYLGDIATSTEKIREGLIQAAAVAETGMPDEQSAADGLRDLAKHLAKASQDAADLQARQHRRNAVDHERLDNRRRNEPGYDSMHPGNNE